MNPRASTGGTLPFVLASSDLDRLHRAVVVVRGWHTEKFSAAVLANAPEMFRFLEPESMRRLEKEFGEDRPFLKILVVPALPAGSEAREEAIHFLRAKRVDAVLPFRTMLANLIDRIETNRNYTRSDLLQILRILKNYEFFPGPQLDLFQSRNPPASSRRRRKREQE